MGQILSWIRGPRDTPALQDMAVEEQSSQTPPKPAAQVSTVKPAQPESASSASAMATKPGVVTTATGGSTTVGAAGKETPKGKPETAPISQDKVTPTVPPAVGTAAAASVTAPKESPKDTAKSTAASTAVKADAPKVDPAKTSKPAAAGAAAAGKVSVEGKKEEVKPTQTKVQAKVPSTAAKGAKEGPAVDAIDELAGILPSTDPIRPEPVYTGPEVREHDITPEKAQKCGERDDTLPPGYRFENMGPADAKPAAVPKPISTDEALDSLSAGFTSAGPDKQKESISASSAAHANFAPPPVKKAETPAAFPMAAPPADKKAKMEKVSDEFSLDAGLPASSTKAGSPVAAPPADKKAKMDKTTPDVSHKAGLETKGGAKPKTEAGDSVSLDALSALGDTLPADVPKPESPKLKPKDIVSEDKVKKEKGVRVGERDDTLPPEYRFKEEDLKKLPPPEPEPKMDTDDALDILSGDFSSSSAEPPVQAPQVCSSAPPVKAKVEDLSALDVLSRDVVASTKASGVQASVPPPSKKPPEKAVCPLEQPKTTEVKPQQTKPKIEKGDSMNLDALSALGDTLPADVPKPESPKLRPEDIVSEGKVKEEKGVRVGERDDTLPPEYRFKEEDLKKLPASKPEKMAESKEKAPKEKTMDDKTALEMLSSDFSAAPKPAAPVTSSAATRKLEPPALDSKPLKPMAGPVLDSLSDTLVPDAIQAKSKTDKPKGKSKSKSKSKKHHTEEPSATEQVAAKQSSDVVPTSTKKGAKS